jgi:hypothetical protein
MSQVKEAIAESFGDVFEVTLKPSSLPPLGDV